jgi:hypothetical protein
VSTKQLNFTVHAQLPHLCYLRRNHVSCTELSICPTWKSAGSEGDEWHYVLSHSTPGLTDGRIAFAPLGLGLLEPRRSAMSEFSAR